ncbi:DUF1643 domain-containing protein [Streptomyces sp. SID8364]|nr:DUF1643 domain-containing protein [Streptomyces sp. SID8364]
MQASDQRILCAILLNPPLRPAEATISHRNLIVALPLTGCSRLKIANLVDLPSKDQVELASLEVTEQDLARSRPLLSAAIEDADEVLFAWGTKKLAGTSGRLLDEQAKWMRSLVKPSQRVWMVGGTPRHPSRWRQFVGPEKQRVTGPTFEARLAKVLTNHDLNGPCQEALGNQPVIPMSRRP